MWECEAVSREVNLFRLALLLVYANLTAAHLSAAIGYQRLNPI